MIRSKFGNCLLKNFFLFLHCHQWEPFAKFIKWAEKSSENLFLKSRWTLFVSQSKWYVTATHYLRIQPNLSANIWMRVRVVCISCKVIPRHSIQSAETCHKTHGITFRIESADFICWHNQVTVQKSTSHLYDTEIIFLDHFRICIRVHFCPVFWLFSWSYLIYSICFSPLLLLFSAWADFSASFHFAFVFRIVRNFPFQRHLTHKCFLHACERAQQ